MRPSELAVGALVVFLLLGFSHTPAKAQTPIGETGFTQIMCLRAGVQALADAATVSVEAGDFAMMSSLKNGDCIFRERPFAVTVLKKMYTFTDPDLATYQIWLVLPEFETTAEWFTWSRVGRSA